MSVYRDKYLRTGLPGPRDFEVKNLVAGDIPVWDNTKNRWTRAGGLTSAASPVTFSNSGSMYLDLKSTSDSGARVRLMNTSGGVQLAMNTTGGTPASGMRLMQLASDFTEEDLWVTGARNGAVTLHYDGVSALATQTSGITVNASATNTFSEVRLVNAAGSQARVRLGSGAPGTFQFSNEADGGLTNFTCDDAGGTARTCISLGTASSASSVAFHGTAAINKPTVTGSRAGNAALASLLTALANYGLITDSSSA